eukprot:CAMPEP_0184686480 /NCGR_PEP_ID=MMETSP0312-20130426/22655_1 /TAXON_ID=31354 /ORGANISM="Compsopogon coeruleus, Strain SAG 36.94" /LENGTH=736 /DNA_ID=CAMNT_0027141619 /DNA_START=183 /DNA_END=2393 /DNA_ORIENTATION=-
MRASQGSGRRKASKAGRRDRDDRLVKHIDAQRRRAEKRARRQRRAQEHGPIVAVPDPRSEEQATVVQRSQRDFQDLEYDPHERFLHTFLPLPQHPTKATPGVSTRPNDGRDPSFDVPEQYDHEFESRDDAEWEKYESRHEEEMSAAHERERIQFPYDEARLDQNQAYGSYQKTPVATPISSAIHDSLRSEIDVQRWTGLDEVASGLYPITTIVELGIPLRMVRRWRLMAPPPLKLSPLETAVGGELRAYRDVMVCAREASRFDRERSIIRLTLLHLLAHVSRARSRVVKNNEKLAASAENPENQEDPPRDQGFTRPRALILLPMRNLAFETISDLVALAVPAGEKESGGNTNHRRVLNWDKFLAEYGPDEEEPTHSGKPKDFQYRFRGNIDDDFKIGIALATKSVKLFSEFYQSDVVVASPMGLKRYFEDVRDGMASETRSDFLSSIEICVVAGAESLIMQNWEHLKEVMDRLNKVPHQLRDTDISRVSRIHIEGKAGCVRQTVLLSNQRNAELNALFRSFRNHSGRIQFVERFSERGLFDLNMLPLSTTGSSHEFLRLPKSTSVLESVENRFQFFRDTLIDSVLSKRDRWGQVVIYIPSYLDYVRVRNLFLMRRKESPSSIQFGALCEHTDLSDVSRARSKFFDRQYAVLLLTERFQFYRRYRIRGAESVLFYGVPLNASLYAEVVQFLHLSDPETLRPRPVRILYDPVYDSLGLEPILGRARLAELRNQRATEL